MQRFGRWLVAMSQLPTMLWPRSGIFRIHLEKVKKEANILQRATRYAIRLAKSMYFLDRLYRNMLIANFL